jgi:hypothetical protein
VASTRGGSNAELATRAFVQELEDRPRFFEALKSRDKGALQDQLRALGRPAGGLLRSRDALAERVADCFPAYSDKGLYGNADGPEADSEGSLREAMASKSAEELRDWPRARGLYAGGNRATLEERVAEHCVEETEEEEEEEDENDG